MGLLTGIATGLGTLGGAFFGKKTTDSANKTNLKINQMNNDFNAREAQKARDFQLDMWNREMNITRLLLSVKGWKMLVIILI